MADKNKYDPQVTIDVITFYTALFYKLPATNKMDGKDFQGLISYTYENLPVRGGGLGKGGFWENICAIHNIPIQATGDAFDERVIKSLADTIWLPYDQDLQNAKNNHKYTNVNLLTFNDKYKKLSWNDLCAIAVKKGYSRTGNPISRKL